MVQDILWKADSHSACQTVACFLYGTRRFITVLTKAHHWTLSWASRIQFAASISMSLRSILMLSSHLRLRYYKDFLLSFSWFTCTCCVNCTAYTYFRMGWWLWMMNWRGCGRMLSFPI